MTRGRVAVSIGLGLVALAGVATMAAAAAATPEPIVIPITIHFSHYNPSMIRVPVGVPVTFVIDNTDPIDHEWIVGDAGVQERHRTGTEPYHNARPTEVSIDAGTTKRTTVTFAK